MTLRFTHTHKSIVSASLLAVVINFATSANAEEVRLFPAHNNNISVTPPELPAISDVEPLPAPAIAETAPAAGQPLRVIIPNIHAEKKDAAQKKEAQPVAANTGVNIIQAGTAPAIAPSAPAPQVTAASAPKPTASEASSLKQFSRAIYEKAQEVWSNGVVIADWSNTPIVRTIFRPNVAFAEIPQPWQLASIDQPDNSVSAAQDTRAIAELTPAAGTADPINIQPPAPIVPSAPVTAVEQNVSEIAALTPAAGAAESINTQPAAPIVPVASIVPTAPTTPVTAAEQPTAPAEPSEPAPSLSSQSKAIANKVPVVSDTKPEKPLAKKVDLDHAKETNVLANAAPKANDTLGIKVGATRTKLDVNYELERAYNALIAGKSEIAIQIYEDILTGQPKNKEALFGLASTYHRLGQIDIARSLYGKLLEIDPKHRDGLNNFLVLLADEAPQEALTQMERLEAQNPSFSPIPAQMAIIYQKLGDRDKAVDKMYRALSIAPENITYRYNLAIMLDKNGKYEDAGKLYTQLLDSHAKGAVIPGDATKIQQRLTFIRSNTSR